MNDLDCPYCGSDNEVCHDDGQGYSEDEVHEMECRECELNFVFTTSVSFDYTPSKADCLNGGSHKFEPTHTYPYRYTRMRCTDCDEERKLTDPERDVFCKDKGIDKQELTNKG